MAYDERLAERIRDRLAGEPGVSERKMFGGIGFMVDGNMCVGVWHDELIARVGPDAEDDALARPGVREFDITGRPMTGWVLVAPEQLAGRGLGTWIGRGLRFVRTLPAKGGVRGGPL